MGNIVLFDGDVIAYQAAFHTQAREDTQEEAKSKIDTIFRWSLSRLDTPNYKTYLTGSNNFRKDVDATYKAQRTTPKPSHLPWCREYLRWEWGAVVSQGEEADDLIAMEVASRGYKDVVVASVDKDFLQLGVPVYNWKTDTVADVTREEGLRFFYKQCIMGDTADNVKGIPGVGPVGAEKALGDALDEKALYERTLGLYEDRGLSIENLISNARLLWLRRKPDEMWEPPT